MKRGNLVTVALPGDYGRPRPALVVSSDEFQPRNYVTVLPLTSTVFDTVDIRHTLDPDRINGLKKISQVMVDMPATVKVEKVGLVIGKIGDDEMLVVESLLALYLGFTV